MPNMTPPNSINDHIDFMRTEPMISVKDLKDRVIKRMSKELKERNSSLKAIYKSVQNFTA